MIRLILAVAALGAATVAVADYCQAEFCDVVSKEYTHCTSWCTDDKGRTYKCERICHYDICNIHCDR